MFSILLNLARACPAKARIMLAALVLLTACNSPKPGSPEAVADAFVDAYFRRADQKAAKPFTALGAARMLDKEIADVAQVRSDGYMPSEASLDVVVKRGQRSMRGERVRFDFSLKYKDLQGDSIKHADIELAQLDGTWKVVRVGLANKPAPAASR